MQKKIAVPETKAVAVDTALIDKSVEFINNTIVKTFYKGSLEIGKYLLKHFFNDDITLASSKNPNKPVSYQALCKRADLEVDRSTISRMVRVAAQERFFKEENVKVEGLSYSHMIEFIKLPNNKKKIQLVKKCIEKKMSCKQLSENVLAIRKKTKTVIEPSPLKLISGVDKLIEKTQIADLLSKPEKLENMTTKDRTQLLERTNDLYEKMKTITEECNTLIQTLGQIEKMEKPEIEIKGKEKEETEGEKKETEKKPVILKRRKIAQKNQM
jgi:hypothetical protein